jgi:hypothetical protein
VLRISLGALAFFMCAVFTGVLAMADERGSETGETAEEAVEEMQKTTDRAEEAVESTIADVEDQVTDISDQDKEGQVIFTETIVTADVEVGDEDLRATAPDLEPIDLDEPAEERLVVTSAEVNEYAPALPEDELIVVGQTEAVPTTVDDLGDLASPLPEEEFAATERAESVPTETDGNVSAAPEGELVVVGPAEALVAEAAVVETLAAETTVVEATPEEPEAIFEGLTTLQALILAFLVLLNVIVIGLGLWQLSLYFGWI